MTQLAPSGSSPKTSRLPPASALTLLVWLGALLSGCDRTKDSPTSVIGQPIVRRKEAVPLSPPKARQTFKVFFEAGLSAEGGDKHSTYDGWVIDTEIGTSALHHRSSPYFEIALDEGQKLPRRARIARGGWLGVEIDLPTATPGGSVFIETRVLLKRQTCTVFLESPRADTDYDTAELVWVRPLAHQPHAAPPTTPVVLPLHFSGAASLPPAPSGVYDLTLTSATPSHARPFTLVRELVLDPELQGADSKARRSFVLPPSVAASYVGFADSWADPSARNGSIGAILGVRIDWKTKTGSLMVVNVPLKSTQIFRYANLRPSPDGVWPISNPQLVDPVTLEFDCPMSFADHHFTLRAADGIFTLKAEFSPPESEAFKSDMFSRMKGVFRDQAKILQEDPTAFDPAFKNLPSHKLPSFAWIANSQNFADHLARLSKTKAATIELGPAVEVTVRDRARLDVRITSQR